jgi:hypothetical protein
MAPPPPLEGSCPVCDGNELFVAQQSEEIRLAGGATVGLSALSICKSCGYVQGQARDFTQLHADSTTGLALVDAPRSSPENRIESEEHEG